MDLQDVRNILNDLNDGNVQARAYSPQKSDTTHSDDFVIIIPELNEQNYNEETLDTTLRRLLEKYNADVTIRLTSRGKTLNEIIYEGKKK